MADLIDRQAAIDAVIDRYYKYGRFSKLEELVWAIEKLPSAEPERLTDDDFETMRIHLNAYREKLCNQRRWEEAEDYERLINRFISFASAQPEIIRCKDCKWWGRKDTYKDGSSMIVCKKGRSAEPEGFCHHADMRGKEDECTN